MKGEGGGIIIVQMFEILVKQTKKTPKTQTKKKQNSARFKEGVHCIVGSTLRFLLSKLPESKTFHCVSYVVYIIFVLPPYHYTVLQIL